MKHLLILFTSLIVFQKSNAQWRVTTPVGSTINDISFPDKYTGYAVFQPAGIGSCTNTMGLYKSIDEGKNWIRLNTGSTNAINAVFFINQLTGWFAASSSEVRKTTDGGVTWTQQTTGVGSGYNDIFFKDFNTGFVTGNNGLLRKSTNGGASWQTITSGVTTALRKIQFVNSNVGFIACGNGQVLKTADGGNTWTAITTGAGGINDIFFTSAQVGYLVSSSNLYTTADGGITWQLSPLVSPTPLIRVYFQNANNGYLIADGIGIYKSTDAGTNWTLIGTMNGINDSWKSICFTDAQTGYIAGYLGRISKTTDAGMSWQNMTSGFGSELFTINAPSKDTAYAGGLNGKIFKTDNGGITFKQQTAAFASAINKVYFLTGSTGFAASDSGRILKTNNGGTTWIAKPTNSHRYITDFSFINHTTGFASAGGGLIFKTTDQGETWDSINTGIADDYRGIWFINADTGFVISSSKIVRSFDGGLSWNAITPSNSSSLSDIVFVNDSVGYCAGGFGKILITKNAGLTWFQTNNNTANAEINEMWFADASKGFFAKQTSQYGTIDSCKNVGSFSTACLANNWTMNSISMTNGGTYGYCAGGLNGIVHQTETPEIISTYTSTNSYCSGSTIFIAYHAKGLFATGNVFTAQLSDASGDFTNPSILGTYTASVLVYNSGIITATLPLNLNGSGYRIRVTASNPAITGPDNGYDITIQPSLLPAVFITSNQGAVCAGSNITFMANTFAGGNNPQYTWYVNGLQVASGVNTYQSITLQNSDTVSVNLISNLSCASNTSAFSNNYVVSINPIPVLALGNDTSVCENSQIQLNAPAAFSYEWLPALGLSNNTIQQPLATVIASTQYQLTITNASGCSATDSIFITAISPPQTPIILFDGLTLSTTLYDAYQWFYNGVAIAGATSQTFIPALSGDYGLSVYNTEGCSSNATPFNLFVTGIKNENKQEYHFYNQHEQWFLQNNAIANPLHFLIMDMTGRVLIQDNIQPLENTAILTNQLAQGIYFMGIINGKNNALHKFVVSK